VLRSVTTAGIVLTGALLLGGCSAAEDAGPDGAATTPSSTGTTATDRPAVEPKRVRCPRLGVYSDWSPDADRQVVRQFGALPQVASSYYQPGDRVRLSEETARIRRGTSPNITITTKGTDLIEALAAGRSHPGFADAGAWLDQYVAALSTLADVDPDVPVYATIDHEFRVKARTGQVTGRSALPEVYGRALDRFFAAAEKANRRIRTTYWMVGYDRDFEATVAEQFRTRPDAVVFDPYPNEAGETLPEIAAEDVEWIRSQDWYDGQELGIGEFGAPVEFGDEAVARFLTDLPQQLAELGVSWAVLFNRDRDFDTRIAGRADGQEYPLARAAFAASLKDARTC
jgi:hypothetical protein